MELLASPSFRGAVAVYFALWGIVHPRRGVADRFNMGFRGFARALHFFLLLLLVCGTMDGLQRCIVLVSHRADATTTMAKNSTRAVPVHVATASTDQVPVMWRELQRLLHRYGGLHLY